MNIALMTVNRPYIKVPKSWKLTICPCCGQECWYPEEHAKAARKLYPDIVFLCTECALKAVKGRKGKTENDVK